MCMCVVVVTELAPSLTLTSTIRPVFAGCAFRACTAWSVAAGRLTSWDDWSGWRGGLEIVVFDVCEFAGVGHFEVCQCAGAAVVGSACAFVAGGEGAGTRVTRSWGGCSKWTCIWIWMIHVEDVADEWIGYRAVVLYSQCLANPHRERSVVEWMAPYVTTNFL
jgi:hypothetical protein